jgi:hypothetical protein
MVRRRTADAGFKIKLGCHVFRATGITASLGAGGTLENAQAMAAHESPRSTKLYDRTSAQAGLTPYLASRSECESDQPERDGHVCWRRWRSLSAPGSDRLASRITRGPEASGAGGRR